MSQTVLSRWAALVLLLALPMAPCAAASTGDLVVDGVAVQGEAVLDGRCRVVHYLAKEAGDSTALTITGQRLRLEVDTRWANTSAGGVAADAEYATSRDEYRNGTFDATDFRAHHNVFLADLPGQAAPRVQWTGAAGRLEASEPGTATSFNRTTRGHPQRSIDLAGSAAWTPSPGWTSLTVTGDFHLILWEVDGRASDGSQVVAYTTGETSAGPTSGVLPLPPSLAVGSVEDRLLHVFAFNATLAWRFKTAVGDPETPGGTGLLAFHVIDATVDSLAPILLSGATGTLEGNGTSVDVRDSSVRVASGRLDAIDAAAGRLKVRLTAPDDALTVDGQPIVWPRSDPGLPRWGVAAIVVALAVGLALAWRWSGSGLRRLERRMDRGRYADVVARRGRVRVRARQLPQASVLHAVSLLALERHDEAGRFLEALEAGERPEPPTFSYLLANVRAAQGRAAEAAGLLRDCLEAAPEYLPEAVANPSLLPLLQSPGLPRPRPPREGAEGAG